VKVGDLVELSARGKNCGEVKHELPEILNSYGVVTEIEEINPLDEFVCELFNEGTPDSIRMAKSLIAKGKSTRYHVQWCAQMKVSWGRGVIYCRRELKYAK